MSDFKQAYSRPLLMICFVALVLVLPSCGQTGSTTGGEGKPADGTTAIPEDEAQGTTQSPPETKRVSEEDAGAAKAPAAWDYVALGDSLAAGVGARRGYVERYAQYLREDTGARVRVLNLGVPGQTSPQLLRLLRNDPSTRRALGGAEVVTFNIGINDLGRARNSYEAGTCGGPRNRECLHAAVEEVAGNWEAIIAEIQGLRSGQETLILTPGLGYVPRTNAFFAPYLKEANRSIAATATANGVPHAEVQLEAEGMSPDGVHPNDRGYGMIADRLRELGYEPLRAR